jgi:hypothetical protein
MNDWTFTFNIDPTLNAGATEAFNQCGEPYWWAMKDGGILGAGDINFSGATFKSLVEHRTGNPHKMLVGG